MLNGYVRGDADLNQVGTSGVEPHDGVLDNRGPEKVVGEVMRRQPHLLLGPGLPDRDAAKAAWRLNS